MSTILQQPDVTYLKKHHFTMWLALCCHRTHKNKRISFDNYQFLKSIYMDRSREMVVMKSTQVGISEYLVARSWGRAFHGKSIFYVLPTYVLKNTFVKDRFDRTIEHSPFYSQAGVKEKKKFVFAESTALKHIGDGAINFVGSNSSTNFTSFSADDVFIDELDECDQDNIAMSPERQGNSHDPYTIKVANPSFEGTRIDYEFARSDKKQWNIRCSNCRKWVTPDFFKHVVQDLGDGDFGIRDKDWSFKSNRDCRTICDNCNKPFNRKVDGEWVKENNNDVSGYHISKMFSGAMPVKYLLGRFNDGQSDDIKLQRFYNGDLGVPFTASGSKIDYNLLDDCVADYSLPRSCKESCIMGVDVGNWLHTIICKIADNGILQTVFIGRVKELEEIIELKNRFKIKCAVIDSMPEMRLSKKFTQLGRGFYRCFYGDTKKDNVDLKKRVVIADRTASLDELKAMFVMQKIILPKNARMLSPVVSDGRGDQVSEFYYHMGASVRVFDEKKERYIWTEGSKEDHLFHAFNYCLIAKQLLASFSSRNTI